MDATSEMIVTTRLIVSDPKDVCNGDEPMSRPLRMPNHNKTMKPQHFMTVLLVAAAGLIDAVVFTQASELPSTSGCIAIGLLLGQLGTLVALVVLSRWHFLLGFSVVLTTTATFARVATIVSEPSFAEWFCVMFVYTASLSVVLQIARMRCENPRRQFSIASILSVTTIVAISIQSVRLMATPEYHLHEFVCICVVLPVLGFACIWALSRLQAWLTFPIVAFIFFVCIGITSSMTVHGPFFLEYVGSLLFVVDDFPAKQPIEVISIIYGTMCVTLFACLQILRVADMPLLPERRTPQSPGVQMPVF